MSDASSNSADLVIHGRWVVPVEPQRTTLEDHCVVVREARIQEILPADQAKKTYRDAEWVERPHHVLLPGLINTHTHAAMSLFRGIADDIPLKTWLQDHIWPAETKWAGVDFIRDGTELAIAEMLLGGTTCFNDMYFFPDVVARSAQDAGIRAVVGLIVIDFPTAWAQSIDEYFDAGLRVHDQVRNLSLISDAFAPHAPYTISDAALEKVRVLADELDLQIHTHLHETSQEIEDSINQHRVRPLERMQRLGLLTPRLLAVHMTQLLPAEIDILGKNGVNVVHCPESNLKLNSGFCPAARLNRADINVALGTDGAASNNDLDMLGEMRSAALLAKPVADDVVALPAWKAIEMATINGARALGLESITGSLLPGKRADLISVDLNRLRSQPVYNPVSQIVYSAAADQVSDVWVDGRQVVRGHALQTLDTSRLLQQARAWAGRIAGGDAAAEAVAR